MAENPAFDLTDCIDSETGKPMDGVPVGYLLSAHAHNTPDSAALTIEGRTISFRELDELANRRARQLQEMGTGQDDRVTIALPNGPEFFECILAVWKLGGTVCPISDKLMADEFAAIVELAKPAAILTSDATRGDSHKTLIIDGPPPAPFSGDPLPPKCANPGRILSSGGSTGRPKLIVDPYPSAWGPEKLGYRRPPRSRVLIASPLYHAAPFSTALHALAQGSHIVCMTGFEPVEWLKTIERHRIDYVYAVPTMMIRVSKLPGSVIENVDLSSIRTFVHMAAPCPPDTKRWWIDRLGPETILEVYGGTERIGLTVIDGAEWLAHPGSVGKAAPGDVILILDDDGNQLPPGEIGEVRFRKAEGPGKTYAYIGSQTRISGGSDSYGDMGWLDKDGYLYIADRRTDMIVRGGVNVYPAEVEAVIDMQPGVLGSAVIGLPDADMGNRLHAIVELAQHSPVPDDETFRRQLRERLTGLKCPATFEFTYERIRDDAGKVRRSALREARLDTSVQ